MHDVRQQLEQQRVARRRGEDGLEDVDRLLGVRGVRQVRQWEDLVKRPDQDRINVEVDPSVDVEDRVSEEISLKRWVVRSVTHEFV